MIPRCDHPPGLVLASGSPRRQELLDLLGHSFEVVSPDIDETPRPGETAPALVERLADAKGVAGRAISETNRAVVIAADTVVVLDGAILTKPEDASSAASMLERLAGRVHRVSTGLSVSTPAATFGTVVHTDVEIRSLTPAEIDWYVATGEPLDKAGAYGIQGIGGSLVTRIDGSYSNVVGLPLAETVELLARAGIDRPPPPLPLPR